MSAKCVRNLGSEQTYVLQEIDVKTVEICSLWFSKNMGTAYGYGT